MTAISERQRAKTFETFLYTKILTHFKNQDNIRYVFI